MRSASELREIAEIRRDVAKINLIRGTFDLIENSAAVGETSRWMPQLNGYSSDSTDPVTMEKKGVVWALLERGYWLESTGMGVVVHWDEKPEIRKSVWSRIRDIIAVHMRDKLPTIRLMLSLALVWALVVLVLAALLYKLSKVG